MIRKLVLTSIAIAAMTLGSLAGLGTSTADAQTSPTPTAVQCSRVGYNNCVAYPDGGFGGSQPTATPRPAQPTSTPVPSADNATATGSGDNAIAFTGAESRVLGYAGAGLIGFGAIALIAARRRTETELD